MTGHIFIYGGIGSGQGEISVNNIKAQIDPQASDYLVHIISPGGEVFEGYGIYNLLKNTGKKVVTQIEGVCASIATLIAFAGEEIIMNKAAEFMIHNPKISDLKGDSYDLRNVADQLDKIKSILIDVSGARVARNGKSISREQLWELYDNETWLTAQEALNMGFVDDVQDAIKAVAKVDLKKFNMEKPKQNWLEGIFKNFLGLQKFKNQFTETLQDGTVILVMSDDEDWTGKAVMYETGEPVPAGEHVLASGKTIVVNDQSVITEVKEAAPPQDNQANEEMENKIKELEAQLAEAKAAKETAEAKAKTEAEKSAKIENRVQMIEKDYLKMKEFMEKTVGDKSTPPKGPAFKNAGNSRNEVIDPMEQEALKYFRNRNIIKNED